MKRNRQGLCPGSQSARDAAYRRDGGRCVMCFRKPAVPHELEPRSARAPGHPDTFRMSNIVCLCVGCHDRWHFGPGLREFRRAVWARAAGLGVKGEDFSERSK